jgi:hemolysin D
MSDWVHSLAAQLDIARLRAVLSDAEDPTVNFQPPAGASPQLVAMARQFLINQVATISGF